MPKRTSKKVTRSEPVSKLSEKTKQNSASMLNFNQAAPKALEQTDGAVDGVLGKIYQLMVDNRKDELDQRKKDESINQTDLKKEEQRHQELLKALTVRRRPKPKRVIRREKKAEEKEAAKPTEPAKKPTEPAKKPAETVKKPPEPAKKPPEPAKKPAEDTAKKAAEDKAKKAAEDRAKKEAEDKAKKAAEDKAKREAEDKAKKSADDRAKKAAEDKAKKEAEDKAKKSAEQVKPPEVKPPPKAEQVKPPEVKPPPKAEAAPAAPKPVTKPPVQETAKKIGPAAVVGLGIAGLLMPTDAVASAIDKASNLVGVSRPLMYAIAKQESAFDPNAGAKTSSAKGLYQFIKGTWAGMVKTYGEKYPILKEKGPEDAEANAIAGALYIKENSAILKKANIPINATTIYTAHFLGAGGARKLFSLPPDSIAAESLPDAAKANDFIFYKKDATTKKPDKNSPRTAKEITDVLFEKVGQYEEKYAKALGMEKNEVIPSTTNTGTKVDQSSKENADLKEKLNKDKSAQTTNNTTTTNNQTNNVKPEQKVDDRPPYARKQQQ